MKQINTALLILFLLIFSQFQSEARSITVNQSKLAKPIHQGGLGVYSKLDLHTLGRDTTKLIACWTYTPSGWHTLGNGADYSAGVCSGAQSWYSSPFGDTLYARSFDGVTDSDTVNISSEDNLDWRENFMVEVLFRCSEPNVDDEFILSKRDESYIGWALRYRSDNRLVLVHSNGSSLVLVKKLNDGLFHLIRFVNYGDSLTLMADDESITDYGSCGAIDNSVNLYLGSFNSSLIPGTSDIAWVMFYNGIPTDSQRDAYWNLLKPYLAEANETASIQNAINILDSNGEIDTVYVNTGTYCEIVECDSIVLVGDKNELPQISGSVWNNLENLICLSSNSSIENFFLNSAQNLLKANAADLTAKRLILSNFDNGIHIINESEKADIYNCTFDGSDNSGFSRGIYHLNASGANQLSLEIKNSVFNNCDSTLVLHDQADATIDNNVISNCGYLYNPLFVTATNVFEIIRTPYSDNFYPLEGSILIDKGICGSWSDWQMQGNAYDIGALELPYDFNWKLNLSGWSRAGFYTN